MQPLLKLSKSF